MVIEKPQLFLERREFLLFVLLMLSLIAARLWLLYSDYRSFVSKPFYYTSATVLNTYPKERDGKHYTVLKLQSQEGWRFFTTTYRDAPKMGARLRLQLYPGERISFWEYLGGFYIKSRIKREETAAADTRTILRQRVAAEHTDGRIAAFYQGIFFAVPLSPELRERIAALGVSHLVALSGFHLGILWAVVYGMLLWLYRPLQQRRFPYRYSLLDVGAVTIVLLGWYVWFVGAPPSLLRSYAMLLVGWVVALLGIELLSFTFLTTVILLLLLLFPALLVSLGFWLSVAGVFYIFLLLQYAKRQRGWVVSLLWIPLGIFVLMLPVVHTLFGMTTPYQLLSPLLSLLFVPFYPLVIMMHLLGIGDLLDSGLGWLLALPSAGSERLLPLWMTGLYLGMSLLAIWRREAFGIVLGAAGAYLLYLFVPFFI